MKHRSWSKIVACLVAGLYIAPAANSLAWPWDRTVPAVSKLDSSAPVGNSKPGNIEQLTVQALQAIAENRLGDAEQRVSSLLQLRPNYRLAHLLQGDLLLARSQALASMGAAPVQDDKLADLREEAQQRHLRYSSPPPTTLIPANLLQFAPNQRHAVLVDAERSRIYLYRNENGVPRYVQDYYATIGKLGFDKKQEGDQRTPLGVYFVNGHMDRKVLDQRYGSRAELYGVGAWPLSYPNDWDRREGRTGSGIWLHGVPFDTFSRAPKASNGCVALSNPDMTELGSYLQAGTPVIIAAKVQWLEPADWQARRQQALNQVENWRQDWESLNTPQYLQHYASDFRVGNLDLAGWRAQKTAVNAGKQWAKIKLADLSLFAYPSSSEAMLLADFEQDYRSNNLDNRMRKRLYFKRQGSSWRIVSEAAG